MGLYFLPPMSVGGKPLRKVDLLPVPMMAFVSWSLGAMCPLPPSTLRGTMENSPMEPIVFRKERLSVFITVCC